MAKTWNNFMVMASLSILLASGCASYGEKVTVGDGDVYYKDGATKEDAQKVADALSKDGYIDSSKKEVTKSIRVLKTGGKNILEVVVKDELAQDEPTFTSMSRIVACDVDADAFKGAPLELHLCDSSFTTKKTGVVEFAKKTSYSKNGVVRLSKDFSDDEGKKLTDCFKEIFGDDSALSLGARKDGETVVISIQAVDKAKQNDKDYQQNCKTVAGGIAEKAFKSGTKVEMELCDDQFVSKAKVSNK